MNILTYIQSLADEQEQIYHFGTSRNYRTLSNSLERFISTLSSPFASIDQITSQFLLQYEAWLHAQGITRNSSSCYLRCLRSALNRYHSTSLPASSVSPSSPSPFQHVYTGVAKTEKRAVDATFISQMRTIDIVDSLVLIGMNPKRKSFERTVRRLTFVRDMFFFCFCARGMTFVDLAYLRRTDISHGIIHYARRKTGQDVFVRIEPHMQTIIDKYSSSTDGKHIYLFPIISSSDPRESYLQYRKALNRFNHDLHTIQQCVQASIHKSETTPSDETSESIPSSLSSYVSRHSWASCAYAHNVPVSIISAGMSHTSLKTTEIYLRELSQTAIYQANHDLITRLFP